MQQAKDAFHIDDRRAGELAALLDAVHRSSQEALAALTEAEREIRTTREHFRR